MRYFLTFILIFVCGVSAYAQLFTRYQSVLDTVAAHSPRVQALRATMEAEQAGARQENVLDDPSVEFGYLWGGDDHRVDFAVSQSFDFPTVYLHRRKAVRQEVANADLRFRMALREVLLQSVQLCVEWETFDSLVSMTQQQCTLAEERMEAIETLYKEGAATVIEHHRAIRDLQRKRQELSRLRTEQTAVIAELETLAGQPICSLSPQETMLLNLEEDDYLSPMDQRYAEGEVARAEAELKAVRSQWWPGLTLGYYSEKESDRTFRGMKVGFTLPVWNNRHRMNQAKATLAAARYDAMDRQAQLEQRITSLQLAAETYRTQANDTRRMLDEQDMVSLLETQLQEGVITRPTYLAGRIECLEDEKDWINLQREALLKQAELESISFQPR